MKSIYYVKWRVYYIVALTGDISGAPKPSSLLSNSSVVLRWSISAAWFCMLTSTSGFLNAVATACAIICALSSICAGEISGLKKLAKFTQEQKPRYGTKIRFVCRIISLNNLV